MLTFRTWARRAATAVFTVAALGCVPSSDPYQGSDPAKETYDPSLGVDLARMTKLSRDLYIQNTVVGTGALASGTSEVTVRYTGWLVNGNLITPNVGGEPITFAMPSVNNGIIQGWNDGIPGMHVGGKRLLVIGSRLAFADQVSDLVPANSTVVYLIELLDAH